MAELLSREWIGYVARPKVRGSRWKPASGVRCQSEACMNRTRALCQHRLEAGQSLLVDIWTAGGQLRSVPSTSLLLSLRRSLSLRSTKTSAWCTSRSMSVANTLVWSRAVCCDRPEHRAAGPGELCQLPAGDARLLNRQPTGTPGRRCSRFDSSFDSKSPWTGRNAPGPRWSVFAGQTRIFGHRRTSLNCPVVVDTQEVAGSTPARPTPLGPRIRSGA